MSYIPFQPVGLASNFVPVSFTGSVGSTTFYSFTIKGGTLGVRDFLELYALFSVNNNANSKTVQVSIGASNRMNFNAASTVTVSKVIYIFGRNSLSAQVATPPANSATYGNTGSRDISGIDFSIDNIIAWKATTTNAGDTITFEGGYVKRFQVLI